MEPQKVLIRPSAPLVPGITKLSPLDQYMIRVVLPLMLVFEIDDSANRSVILHNLQKGLSHAIDELNFLAADVVIEDEERDSIQLEHGAEAGVWFTTKELPEFKFKDLASCNFKFAAMPVTKFSPQPLGHSKRTPVLSVEVTFITGGCIVAFNGHHAVMDAQGLGTFSGVWAKHVAAVSEGRLVPAEEMIAEEAIDASGIFGVTNSLPMSDFPTFQSAKDRPYETKQAEIQKTAVSGDHGKLSSMIKLSHWAMSQDDLDALKAAAMPPSSADPAVTENAIMSALVWLHVSRARGLTARNVASSSILSSVNVRRRMEPPIPIEYPGNAIILGRATASAEQLSVTSGENIYALAKMIGDSIDWWGGDQIWALTGAIDNFSPVGNTMIPPLDYDILVTSPSRLGDVLGKAAWGPELGKLQALRFAFPAFMDGFALVLPAIGGGQDIMLWTAPEVVDGLRDDSEWMKWVHQLE